MHHQLLYQSDVTRLEFTTTLLETQRLPNGRYGAILDQTYFYPVGGGQEADTGYLAEARVLDVYKLAEPGELRLVHVIDRDLPPGPVKAKIDGERRQRHMQHHTAQHLLSQCFLRLYEIDSVSANINGITPSTLDLAVASLTTRQVEQVESLANQIIYENRLVRTYFVTPEELQKLSLRWPPKVHENIRIVEIDGYDYTPCGGTHCLSTGSIGLIKILKTERQNEQTRLFFVAGTQALDYFRQYQGIAVGLANQLSVHPAEVMEIVTRQVEALKAAQKELQLLRADQTVQEAQRLAAAAPVWAGVKLILKSYPDRPASELRSLAVELVKIPRLAAILAASDGKKIALTVVSAPETKLNARELLSQLLSPIGGRGGGDAQLAQGGGAGGAEQVQEILSIAETIIHAAL